MAVQSRSRLISSVRLYSVVRLLQLASCCCCSCRNQIVSSEDAKQQLHRVSVSHTEAVGSSTTAGSGATYRQCCLCSSTNRFWRIPS
jgi:hypothetical protein